MYLKREKHIEKKRKQEEIPKTNKRRKADTKKLDKLNKGW